MVAWCDNRALATGHVDRSLAWLRVLPLVALHLGCLSVLVVGASPFAITAAALLYVARMFAITGFYHRYFAHRAFRASRFVQFLLAVAGATAVQRGPLWWASHHRHHHAHADDTDDAHSPHNDGFAWSHFGWFLARSNFATREGWVRDLAGFPELRFLDRFDVVVPALYGIALYATGEWLAYAHPALRTSGSMLFVWGFCVSTVVLYHATFAINSLAHTLGSRRYATRDHSRNNALLALLTLGEGWHNNHHHFPGAARQGFFWWEVDFTYYGLRTLAAFGMIRDLRHVPAAMRDARRIR
jgi:stearoyl-CoA desaturase (delta-9 desaturase)